MGKAMPICNTEDFLYLCKAAEKRGFNRQPDVRKMISIIDLEGTHICAFSMYHSHIAGEKVEPHIRSMWYVKCEDQEKPLTVFLDISMENFNKLHEIDMETKEMIK